MPHKIKVTTDFSKATKESEANTRRVFWSRGWSSVVALVAVFILVIITSCSEDLTSPGGSEDIPPPVFFGEGNDNQINLVYGNGGVSNAMIPGRMNTGFHFTSTNAAFRFSQVVVPGSDSTSSLMEAGGIVLNPLSSTVGLNDVDKVSDGSQAAYRFIPPSEEGAEVGAEVGRIAVNNLTPVNSSAITLQAVFTNATNVDITQSFDFDVEINIAPYNIANLGLTDQALADALVNGRINGGNFLNRATTNTSGMVALNYSGLADFVNGLIEPSNYPQSPVAKPFEIGLDFGIRLSIDGQTALADGSGYRFTGLSPTQLNDYRLAFTLTSLGNFTGSAGVVGDLNVNESQESLGGYLGYDIADRINLGEIVNLLPATDKNGFNPGTGEISYSIVSPAVNGISLSDSSTGELTVNASTLGVTNHQVEVQVVSSHGGIARTSFVVNVVAPLEGTISYGPDVALTTMDPATNIVVNADSLDIGSGSITYEITNRVLDGLPNEIEIDLDTGEISLPGTLSAGNYPIGVQVSSSDGGSASAELSVNVREPLSGTLVYDGGNSINVDTTATMTRTIMLDRSRLTLGSEPVSYSITSGTTTGISINDSTGDITINPSALSTRTYTVDITLQNSYGDRVGGSLSITAAPGQVPLSGNISYNNTTLELGSMANLSVDTSGLAPGTGTPTYDITSITTSLSGGTSGAAAVDILINPNSGEITIGSTLEVADYTVNVSVTSDHMGQASTSLTVSVVHPVEGTFSYTAPAATDVKVHLTRLITPILSNLSNYTRFSIAPSDPSVDLGGVTVSGSGAISVTPERLGRAEYTVTAHGATFSRVTTSITIESILEIDLQPIPTSARLALSNSGNIQLASGGTTSINSISTVSNLIIDNDRTAAFNFNTTANDFLAYGYYNSADDRTLNYIPLDTGDLIQIGDDGTTTPAAANVSVSLGLTIDPKLFLAAGNYEVVVRIARSSNQNSNLGYIVMLSDGRNSSTAGIGNPRYIGDGSGADAITDSYTLKSSTFTYAGDANTLTLYFSAPTNTEIMVEDITIRLR